MRVVVHLIKSFLRFQHISESLGELVKIQIAILCPRVSDSVGLGWSLRICISNKFPNDADVAGFGDTL